MSLEERQVYADACQLIKRHGMVAVTEYQANLIDNSHDLVDACKSLLDVLKDRSLPLKANEAHWVGIIEQALAKLEIE